MTPNMESSRCTVGEGSVVGEWIQEKALITGVPGQGESMSQASGMTGVTLASEEPAANRPIPRPGNTVSDEKLNGTLWDRSRSICPMGPSVVTKYNTGRFLDRGNTTIQAPNHEGHGLYTS